jgi:hypothetical protein
MAAGAAAAALLSFLRVHAEDLPPSEEDMLLGHRIIEEHNAERRWVTPHPAADARLRPFTNEEVEEPRGAGRAAAAGHSSWTCNQTCSPLKLHQGGNRMTIDFNLRRDSSQY